MNTCAVPEHGHERAAGQDGPQRVVPYKTGDDVYRERACLVAYLATLFPARWWSDPAQPDWPIVYLETPAGQLSWHIAACDVELFPALPTVTGRNPWDGHDTDEKYRRLACLSLWEAQARRLQGSGSTQPPMVTVYPDR